MGKALVGKGGLRGGRVEVKEPNILGTYVKCQKTDFCQYKKLDNNWKEGKEGRKKKEERNKFRGQKYHFLFLWVIFLFSMLFLFSDFSNFFLKYCIIYVYILNIWAGSADDIFS